MDTKKITHLPLLLKKDKRCGLKRNPEGAKHFETGIFGWGKYKPKHTVKLIKTLSVKDQGRLNTCQWNATTAQKENDEGCILSVKGLVGYGKKNGMISGDGFSSLDSGQKALKDWGIPEEKVLPSTLSDWESYSNVDIGRFTANANQHKIASHWNVSSKDDMYKLLDEDRTLVTGTDWFTPFNSGGIITKSSGYNIGGHAYLGKGYVRGLKKVENQRIITGLGGINVFAFQNSFGDNWGYTIIDTDGSVHKGIFFVEENYFWKNRYGIKANLDISLDIGKFINDYDGKNVKGSKPTIYSVQQGKLKAYPDEVTYLAYNANDSEIKSYSLVKDEIIAKVPKGDDMDIRKSLYWDMLKGIEGKEERIKKLIEILHTK